MYLKEVQGLRLFAALLVAAYHIWFQRVSGAVDAFFVVAGFFIFRSLYRKGVPGWSDVLRLYKRTAARIAPSASIVIAATCAIFYWLDVDSLWSSQIKNAIASLLFVENWWLAFNSIDYLARDETPSPFQQMWALSVQVQIYLLLPLMLFGLSALIGKAGAGMRALTATMLGLAILSFVYALVGVATDQSFAYFDTFARVWEFLVGALLAAVLPRIVMNPGTAKLLGYACLALLTGFAAVIHVADAFPGWAALVPVCATVGLIAASANHAGMGLLANPVMQRLGDLSFTFYLWHWPLLVMYWLVNAPGPVGILPGLGIILTAGILAFLTYEMAERPFRRSRIAKGPLPVSLLASALVMTPGGLAVGSWAYSYIQARDAAFEAARSGETADLVPATIIAKADVPISYEDKCLQRWGRSELVECTYGNPEGSIEIALIGGSHSLQWLPALRQIARDETDLKITVLNKGNCPLTLSGENLELKEEDVCLAFNTAAVARVQDLSPNLVVTLLTTTQSTSRNPVEHIPPGKIAAWQALSDFPILAIRDNPRSARDVVDCVDRNGPEAEECLIFRETSLRDDAIPWNDLPAHVTPLDLTPYFCGDVFCPPVRDGILVYRDKTHITATFARSLAPELHKALASLTALDSARR